MILKKIIFGCFFILSGCGFSPLYHSVEGESSPTEQVLVSPIADYNGYMLKQRIENALNPKKISGPKNLSSTTTALGAFNIFYEPYTTYQAEKKQTDDLIQVVANNISLRVAAYLKQKEVKSESKTSSN